MAYGSVSSMNATSRSSSRLRQNKAGAKSTAMSQDVASQDGEEEEYQPPAKKRRTNNASTKVKRVRGKLALLPSMPMDILFEIMGCLRPLDLLHLSRVNKAFRDVLMHRSSRSVWKDVLASITNLPSCPQDMSEPSWSSLLFETRCHICYAPNAKNTHWEIRLRACDKCSADLFEPAYHRVDFDIVRALPNFNVRLGRRRMRCVYIPQVDKLNDELRQFAIMDELDTSEREMKLAARAAFLQGRTNLLTETIAHAQLCKEWSEDVASDRAEERNTLKAQRYKAICEHLTTLGYEKEIAFKPTALLNHKLVKEPRTLTARIWKNVQEALVKLMETVRVERLQEERVERIRSRQQDFADFHREYIRSQTPETQAFPSFGDVLAFEPFKSMIETDADQDKTLDFTPHLPAYPEITERWRRRIKKELVDLLHGSVPKPSEHHSSNNGPNSVEATTADLEDLDFSCLELATSVFVCKRCKIPVHYPQVTHHDCLWHRSYWSYDSSPQPQTWDIGRLMVPPSQSNIAKSLVKACGLDPSTATSAQLDELDIFFRNRACEHQKSTGMMNLSWRDALKHSFRHDGFGSHRDDYVRLSDDQLAMARQRKEEFIASDREEKWSCEVCGHLPGSCTMFTKNRLENHFVYSHQLPRDHTAFYANPGYVPIFGDLGDYEPDYNEWDDWDGLGLHYQELAEDLLFDLFDYY